jgi:hypothetical protein
VSQRGFAVRPVLRRGVRNGGSRASCVTPEQRRPREKSPPYGTHCYRPQRHSDPSAEPASASGSSHSAVSDTDPAAGASSASAAFSAADGVTRPARSSVKEGRAGFLCHRRCMDTEYGEEERESARRHLRYPLGDHVRWMVAAGVPESRAVRAAAELRVTLRRIAGSEGPETAL